MRAQGEPKLAELRRRVGLTQAQLSARSGVSVRAISAIEAAGVLPNYPTRRRILKALGLPFSNHIEVFDARRL